MPVLKNRAYVSTATTGTGTITLASPVSGYQSFADAGVTNGNSVRYTIEDGANFEIGTGTYTASGTTLSRTPSESSNSGSAINLSGSARVFITAAAEDILQPSNNLSDLANAATARTNLGFNTGVDAHLNTSTAANGEFLSWNGSDYDWAAVASGAFDYTRATKTANYTVVAGDLGKIIDVTSNSVTISLTAAATLGDGFYVYIRNSSSTATDVVTIDGNGSETIDGSPLIYLRRFEGIHLVCDGSGFFSLRTRVDGLQTNFAQQSHQLDQPTASGTNSLALGFQTDATNQAAISVGYQTAATGSSSMAFGNNADATGQNSLAVGMGALASDTNSVAIGSGSGSEGPRSQAAGAVAIGRYSKVVGTDGIAGPYSYISGNYGSVAFGVINTGTSYGSQGNYSVSIGQLAKATAANSIAIGDTATSTVANLIALGGTTDTVKISGAYTLPTADGAAGTALVTNGSGALSFSSVGGAEAYTRDTKTANYTVVAGDLGKIIDVTSNSVTITMTSAATLGAGFYVYIRNSSTTNGHVVTVVGTSSQTINGSPNGRKLYRNEFIQLVCDGSNFYSLRSETPGLSTNLELPNSLGNEPDASGLNSICLGFESSATGVRSFTAGYQADATGDRATALGNSATASGTESPIAIGDSVASGSYAIAIGPDADALNTNTIAIGRSSLASNSEGIAIGKSATSSATSDIALGKSRANGSYSTAINVDHSSTTYGASGQYGISFAYHSKSSGSNSIAIGNTALSGTGATAVGYLSTASGTNSAAFGYAASTTHSNSTAIGNNASTNAANQVAIGNSSHAVRISEAYTLPTSDGSANQVLTTNGSGVVSFADAGGGADLYAAETTGSTDPTASGTLSIAIGSSAIATGNNSIAIGNGADVFNSWTGAVAIGPNSGANGAYSVAIGEGTSTYSGTTGSLAIGQDAQAVSQYCVAIGKSRASQQSSFAAVIYNNSSSYGTSGTNSIAMGYLSKATGIGNINIGYEGYATGASGSVALGYRARATGTNAICLGQSGYSTASGDQSLAIGYSANATATHSMAIGRSHTIQAQYATAIGGRNSEATSSAQYGIVTGYEAKIEIYGKSAHASGKFAAVGDAQGGQYILRADTTDATATVLTTNNSTAAATNQIAAPVNDTCITFDGTITAMQNGAQAYASWKIEGLLVNDGGTTTLANSATTVIQNLSSWGMALSADNTNNALAITCTGEASHNIRWVANIRTTEVTYA